jgi:uncharacterized small protein (DUF1192 family)
MSGTLANMDDFYENSKPTNAELAFVARKQADLEANGFYVVTVQELDQLQVEIEREEAQMAKKKVTTKKVAKKVAKKVSKKTNK